MADTTKSIKNATDVELNAIVGRLRREREILRMLRELKVKSKPNPNGPWPSYNISDSFSTETPVSNGKSIKEMTDQELNTFLVRLQNENEVAGIIREIQNFNNPVPDGEGMYPDGKAYEGISFDTPIKDLYHYGVLGMHWGQIKAAHEQRKAAKQQIQQIKDRRNKLQNEIIDFEVDMESKLFPKYQHLEKAMDEAYFKGDNDKGIKLEKERNTLRSTLYNEYVSKNQHKLPAGVSVKIDPDSFAGDDGALEAQYFYNNKKINFQFGAEPQKFLLDPPDVQHSELDNSLEHAGVLGMRWGHRKEQGPPLPYDMANKRSINKLTGRKAGLDAAKTATNEGRNIATTMRSHKERQAQDTQLKSSKKLSDAELRKRINRLQMEQQYSQLSARDTQAGKTRLEDILSVSGNVLAIAAAGAGLALTIKQLKGGG